MQVWDYISKIDEIIHKLAILCKKSKIQSHAYIQLKNGISFADQDVIKFQIIVTFTNN